MTITSGVRLGPYDILAPLGTGGPRKLERGGLLSYESDFKSHAYACWRMASHLFLVEGAR